MPILDIEIVGDAAPAEGHRPARALADAAGRIFGGDPGTTWVRVRHLAADAYAENGIAASPTPVFVTVMKRCLPEPADLAAETATLTQSIAAVLERPAEHVHVVYEPAAAGRAAFGGRLVEGDETR